MSQAVLSVSLLAEQPLTISQAAKTAPGRPSVSTCWRWAMKGVRGVKLESYVRGGRRFTTADALQRFIYRTTAASDGNADGLSPTESRRREIDTAEAACREAGI